MESGRLYPNKDYVREVGHALGLTKLEISDLLALFDLFETEHSRLAEDEAAALQQQAISQLEMSAAVVRCFDCFAVPGLLQVPAYCKAVFGDFAQKDVVQLETDVRARIERQAILDDEGRQFLFLMTEGALRNRICSASVMSEQLDHIKQLARSKGNLTIAFIPWTTFLPTLPSTNFNIHDNKIVISDTMVGFMSFRKRADVEAHLRFFEQFMTCSVSGETMLASLDLISAEYRQLERAQVFGASSSSSKP